MIARIKQIAAMEGVSERMAEKGLETSLVFPGDRAELPLHPEVFRITSYNVCYTKLLRLEFNKIAFLGPIQRVAVDAGLQIVV